MWKMALLVMLRMRLVTGKPGAVLSNVDYQTSTSLKLVTVSAYIQWHCRQYNYRYNRKKLNSTVRTSSSPSVQTNLECLNL